MYSVYEINFNMGGNAHMETVEVSNLGELEEIKNWLVSKGCKNITASFLYDEDEYWNNYFSF